MTPHYPIGPDRRATPRVQVHGRIQGEIESKHLQVRVCDIGAGGFSIEAADPIEPGLHVVRFTRGHWSISLSAWSRHSRPFCGTDGVLRHAIGFEYADAQNPDTRQMIDALIERVTSVLWFE